MKYDASRPDWPDRDRFVLSSGPRVDAALLDALPHRLRARARRPPAVPAVGLAHARPPRVAPHHRASRSRPVRSARASRNAVGMAIAESTCAPASAPTSCDHHMFGICSDGDLEEGISHEAASLAGHLQLGRLVVRLRRQPHHDRRPDRARLQRRRRQALRGLRLARRALGEAANDLDALEAGCAAAWPKTTRPSLIVLRSHIGYPSPKFTTPRTRTATRSAPTRSRVKGDPRPCRPTRLLRARRRARATTARPAVRERPHREAWDERRADGTATAPSCDACTRRPRGLARLGAEAARRATSGEQVATRAGDRRC